MSDFRASGALMLISPILNSNKEACDLFARALNGGVGGLISITSMVAPGLARYYVLYSASCSRLVGGTSSPSFLSAITRLTGGLLRLCGIGAIVIANVRRGVSSRIAGVGGLVTASSRIFYIDYRGANKDCSNANSLFTSIIFSKLLHNSDLGSAMGLTMGFVRASLYRAMGLNVLHGRNVRFRGRLGVLL